MRLLMKWGFSIVVHFSSIFPFFYSYVDNHYNRIALVRNDSLMFFSLAHLWERAAVLPLKGVIIEHRFWEKIGFQICYPTLLWMVCWSIKKWELEMRKIRNKINPTERKSWWGPLSRPLIKRTNVTCRLVFYFPRINEISGVCQARLINRDCLLTTSGTCRYALFVLMRYQKVKLLFIQCLVTGDILLSLQKYTAIQYQ